MDWAVVCPCGHKLESHIHHGCTGDRPRGCHCVRDRYAALEAAVDAVKTRPWRGRPPASDDEATVA